jgi:apolipoprotein N-acyltransferase
MAVVLALLAGFLLSCAFAPLSLWLSAPIAITLLLKLLDRHNFRKRCILVASFSVAFFIPLLHWTSTYVGSIPWLILALGEAAFLLPLALLPIGKRGVVFYFPSLWVAVEVARSHLPFGGFGWGRVGFSQSGSPYAKIASITGVSGLSFLVCSISVSFYLLLKGDRLLISISFVFVVAQLASVGIQTTSNNSSGHISVLAVQGGVPQLGLNFNERATAVFTNHLKLTREYFKTHTDKVDLVVWPENSVDVDPFTDIYERNSLQQLVDTSGVPIIIGAVLQGPNGPQNASILWMPGKGATSTYIKMHLTPFGEYMPMRALAEFISPYAKNVVDFIPGKTHLIHKVGSARLAPVICYELVDDQLSRAMNVPANVMLVQTNSATFGLSAESAQELEIVRVRAIEHQRYAVSISTSGVSAIIDNNGKVLAQTRQNVPKVLRYDLALNSSRSVADRLGNSAEILIIVAPLFISIVLLLPQRISALNRRRRVK